ncbi:MAG: hypothetical protein M3R07_10240 [Gemmatimonadota bacterium]|nr:hypothetical protein [Gemmatimonadota bacterium]
MNDHASRRGRRRGWWTSGAILLSGVLCTGAQAAQVNLSKAEAFRIGKKVWQNECAGTIAGLTSWNAGENFASLGIGHFIWYPKGARGPFEESFPAFISFAEARKTILPNVVRENRSSGCPWASHAEFTSAGDTAEMKQLRQFLADTIGLQADFLVQRLEQSVLKMLAAAPSGERANIQRQFDRVASTAHGCYALVDYVNFKGEGVLETERYRGRGWGLLQVLAGMSGTNAGISATQDFAQSARQVLSERVKNSPPERGETRWLRGWLDRVNSYNEA